VGFAVLYTTIIIIAGFASLGFSDFVPSVLFGLLTGVALTGALLFDVTLMPVLLNRFANSGNNANTVRSNSDITSGMAS